MLTKAKPDRGKRTVTCGNCRGQGEYFQTIVGLAAPLQHVVCPACNGTGEIALPTPTPDKVT